MTVPTVVPAGTTYCGVDDPPAGITSEINPAGLGSDGVGSGWTGVPSGFANQGWWGCVVWLPQVTMSCACAWSGVPGGTAGESCGWKAAPPAAVGMIRIDQSSCGISTTSPFRYRLTSL